MGYHQLAVPLFWCHSHIVSRNHLLRMQSSRLAGKDQHIPAATARRDGIHLGPFTLPGRRQSGRCEASVCTIFSLETQRLDSVPKRPRSLTVPQIVVVTSSHTYTMNGV